MQKGCTLDGQIGADEILQNQGDSRLCLGCRRLTVAVTDCFFADERDAVRVGRCGRPRKHAREHMLRHDGVETYAHEWLLEFESTDVRSEVKRHIESGSCKLLIRLLF